MKLFIALSVIIAVAAAGVTQPSKPIEGILDKILAAIEKSKPEEAQETVQPIALTETEPMYVDEIASSPESVKPAFNSPIYFEEPIKNVDTETMSGSDHEGIIIKNVYVVNYGQLIVAGNPPSMPTTAEQATEEVAPTPVNVIEESLVAIDEEAGSISPVSVVDDIADEQVVVAEEEVAPTPVNVVDDVYAPIPVANDEEASAIEEILVPTAVVLPEPVSPVVV